VSGFRFPVLCGSASILACNSCLDTVMILCMAASNLRNSADDCGLRGLDFMLA